MLAIPILNRLVNGLLYELEVGIGGNGEYTFCRFLLSNGPACF